MLLGDRFQTYNDTTVSPTILPTRDHANCVELDHASDYKSTPTHIQCSQNTHHHAVQLRFCTPTHRRQLLDH